MGYQTELRLPDWAGGAIYVRHGTSLRLVLAAAGLYAVMAYIVTERTGEIGIRMALGAQPYAILRLVMNQAFLLVGLGIAIGLSLGAVIPRVLGSMVAGIGRYDPWVFCLAPVLIIITSAIANWIPARRATRLDPIEALRAE